MPRLETLSTDGVAPTKRVDFWNAAACDALTAQSAEPRSPLTFSGRLSRRDVGELRFVEFSSDAAVIRRSRAHIARSRDAYFIIRMQLTGESISTQDDREVLLKPGDFTLCDCVRPYKVSFGSSASMLALRVSRSSLQRYIGSPEALVHLPISGSVGPGVLASRMIREVWQASDDTLVPEVAPRIANVILELVASAYVGQRAAKVELSCGASSLRVRILMHLDDSLRDPDLTPTKVAKAFRITPRYLHRLFQQQGETVARYVLRRRLERSRAALADPLLGGLSLTRISGEQGFKSLPHFSHVFRQEYGMSPSDYRFASKVSGHVSAGQAAGHSATSS
jgi:AraC-like DNA-binding protein